MNALHKRKKAGLDISNKVIFRYFIVLIAAAIAGLAGLPAVRAAESYMFLSSGSGVYPAGKEITTRLVINSGGIPGVNAADGRVQFDPAFLEVRKIATSSSLFQLWTTPPTVDNKKGTIVFGGGYPGKYTDSAGVLFSVTFRPKKSGKTTVTFGVNSVLSADGKAKNILIDKLEAVYYFGTQKQVSEAASLAGRMSGRILLQVERNGEAWYVYPRDKRRYFLGRPLDAFTIMRKLGLGASHKYITSYKTYPKEVWGRILLDVERNGEAYYINPADKKAYYLGRPKDAFRIMREKGLGIKNDQLYRIADWAI